MQHFRLDAEKNCVKNYTMDIILVSKYNCMKITTMSETATPLVTKEIPLCFKLVMLLRNIQKLTIIVPEKMFI